VLEEQRCRYANESADIRISCSFFRSAFDSKSQKIGTFHIRTPNPPSPPHDDVTLSTHTLTNPPRPFAPFQKKKGMFETNKKTVYTTGSGELLPSFREFGGNRYPGSTPRAHNRSSGKVVIGEPNRTVLGALPLLVGIWLISKCVPFFVCTLASCDFPPPLHVN